MFQQFMQFFHNNMVFAGLFMTMITGSIFYLFKAIPKLIFDAMVRYFTISVTILSEEDTHHWVSMWLSNRYSMDARKIKIIKKDKVWSITIGFGAHLFWYNNRPLLVQRIDETDKSSQSYFRREKIIITTVGRSKNPILNIIKEAEELKGIKKTVSVYTFKSSYWQESHEKEKRLLDSLYLPTEQKNTILEDSKWFFNSKKWYTDRGIPYRRGYLLYGLPGTGKSSLTLVLSSILNKPVYYLNLNSIVNDDTLITALTSVPNDSILLIEDVDTISLTKSRDIQEDNLIESNKENKEKELKITLSGLLNGLDGIPASEGRLLIMTTNHIEKLDPALIRNGRIDQRFYFDNMKLEEVRSMFMMYFPNAYRYFPVIEKYYVSNKPMVAADWQSLFMLAYDNIDKLISSINQKEPSKNIVKSNGIKIREIK